MISSNHVRAFWQVAVLGLVLLASFAGGDAHAQSGPAEANSAAAERLTVDTPLTTSTAPHSRRRRAGASLPARTRAFSIRAGSGFALALIDVQAADADAAVAAAWAGYRPDANRPLKLAVPMRRTTAGKSAISTV